MAQKINHKWVVALIDQDHIARVQRDLNKFKDCKLIEFYIPTLRRLKKEFKGKQHFEYLPLLFNYGFFKLPEDKIYKEFLDSMKNRVPCIYSWLIDKAYKPNKVALITEDELYIIKRYEKNASLYTKEDLATLAPGTVITLRGYPFEGMNAKILALNFKKEEAKVELHMDEIRKEIRVSFDNLLYTIYIDPDPDSGPKESSLDEIKSKGKNNIDKLYYEKTQP